MNMKANEIRNVRQFYHHLTGANNNFSQAIRDNSARGGQGAILNMQNPRINFYALALNL